MRLAMAIIRLANGSDLLVKMPVPDVMSALRISAGGPEFVELPGDDGPILVRPSGVIAVIEDTKRGTAGFRVAQGGAPVA
jgi:hypothetical protein